VYAHTVFCVKLKRELPGWTNSVRQRPGPQVYDNVSQEAWRMWTEHCKMLLNEYRLNPARREDQEVIVKQLEQFFFGEGSAVPKSMCHQLRCKRSMARDFGSRTDQIHTAETFRQTRRLNS